MGKFKIEHLVNTVHPDSRLDLFIKSLGVRLSRTRIIDLIEDGRAKVNGKIEKPSYKVKHGDLITVDYECLVQTDVKPEEIPLNIIYEDNDIIVINKDDDMVVHPAKGNRDGTLVNALLHHTQIVGGNAERPGVVHRLDKDTSGVMVFAKNEEAHAFLAGEIEKRRVKRTYMTIVWGSFTRKRGTVNAPIGRSNTNRKVMAVTSLNSREAITDYKVLHDFKIASLLKVNLQTGRTHQIRVHLTHIEHPLVGDHEYNKNVLAVVKEVKLDRKQYYDYIVKLIDRQALHAVALKFRHPRTKEEVEFFAPLPEDFMRVLNYLWSLEKENK
ncbi:TPA: RNA pseudouridine synthase [candidate division WOR-3 bacterium]|jgi:23S rRNA pseudouridine1911/1915/1917 synthase|uniref:Pseudouridine synthase n=1 Tax=candidate division WOR-3 bacterium TaxID=2052148 RepID=A0A350HBX4_UNCW3|nr:RNA pseudouridine synthase [candidate division WOR-3 bacterium]